MVPGSAIIADGRWCLVLALWGQAYSEHHVNAVVRSALRFSSGCSRIILFTDRIRPGVDSVVEQTMFPEFFNRAEFFLPGYVVKLSIFDRDVLPHSMRCVYLDLDTVVCGDLGVIAALVRGPNDYAMLPPGGAFGFGWVRAMIRRMTKGERLAVGNSSIMAYHSAAEPNLCNVYRNLYGLGVGDKPYMHLDDLFISWFAQAKLRNVPKSCGVMFRREFLCRSKLLLWCRSVLPGVRRRRERIVAITLNGERYKPSKMLSYPDGARIIGCDGRSGYWMQSYLGSAKSQIEAYCRAVSDVD